MLIAQLLLIKNESLKPQFLKLFDTIEDADIQLSFMVMINFLTQEKSSFDQMVEANKYCSGDEMDDKEMQYGKVPLDILDYIHSTIFPSPQFKTIQKEAERHFRKISQAKAQGNPFAHNYSHILKDQFCTENCPFDVQFLKEQFEWVKTVTEKQVTKHVSTKKHKEMNKTAINQSSTDDFQEVLPSQAIR